MSAKGLIVLTTTLNKLIKHYACEPGLETLRVSLPGDYGQNTPITLAHILESNGLDHAVWALRTQNKKFAVKFAKLCAERAEKYTDADAYTARYAACYVDGC